MTTEPRSDNASVIFPLQATRALLSEVAELSVDSLEAHGSGKELKLFEFANTIADVMVCMPHRWANDPRIGPREYLMHLGQVLGMFRGGNEALLPFLRSRFDYLLNWGSHCRRSLEYWTLCTRVMMILQGE